MSDQTSEKVDATAPAAEAPVKDVATEQTEAGAKQEEAETAKEAQNGDAEKTEATESKTKDAATEAQQDTKEEPAAEGDTEMKDATVTEAADETLGDASLTETPSSKLPNRRKSTGGDKKGKTLSKKASKAKISHADAKPGDHFLVKLKGFPAWPCIVCDESMLPQALVTSRPVTAARPDGTYKEAYADGAKRVNDRTFPVMYLFTNEFGWVAQGTLTELTPEKASASINEKMRKDLKGAFELAAEAHPLDHYKDILKTFQAELIQAEEEERAAAAAAAAAAATPKKSKKAKAAEDDDADVDMSGVGESAKAKSKKRKADESTSTPQRTDSVKKPKIKLNTSSTPKTANGTATPKAADESATKSATKAAKPKQKKAKDGAEKKDKQDAKDAKMTPEERRVRKEKEVMYLRHKLQRGLLTRDQEPQESEMKLMSEYITSLERYSDLEVSIIRKTKINKVLKAILKLENIPKEAEFKFKDRSGVLLDQWNKLLASDAGQEPADAANGVNGGSESTKKTEANGAKAEAATEVKKSEVSSPEETKEASAAAEAEEKPEEVAESEKKADEPETAAAVEATA